MFWADEVALKLKERNLPLEWVDDMKTPSGKIHVGALRGVVVHDLAYKALLSIGKKAEYTYVFEDQDPMDSLPVYLPQEKYEKYMGMPLFQIPSPVPGYENYAEYYAEDFKKVFNAIGCNPKIIWVTKDLYMSGKMNPLIKECLDKAEEIREIYGKMYKKKLPHTWYPFQLYCPKCGKVSTTEVTHWDGEQVTYQCLTEKVKWTKGCGTEGKANPFSDKDKIRGKLPWKVEWAAKWKVIGVTVEGGGKDHMSRGGSYDLSSQIAEKILNYTPPYPLPYEFFLIGGAKMSSSKGVGSSASEILEILPPEILRFLMVRTNKNQAINFDPKDDTIPRLFDEYQKAALAYFENGDKDLARIFELSQIGKIKKPPKISFLTLVQRSQMPNMDEEIEKENAEEWMPYVKIWIERFAPEKDRFMLQDSISETAKKLSLEQKKYLRKIALEINNISEAEKLQEKLYEWAKELNIDSKDAFSGIYQSLFGKNYGPKAAWVILQNKDFVKKHFSKL